MKPKPVVNWVLDFSRACPCMHDFTTASDSFIVVSGCVVIGWMKARCGRIALVVGFKNSVVVVGFKKSVRKLFYRF